MKKLTNPCILFFLLACSSPAERAATDLDTTTVGPGTDTIPVKKETPAFTAPSSYFIFGKSCGMCIENCSSMFMIDTAKETVYIDHSGEYYRTRSLSAFAGKGIVGYEYERAEELLNKLPPELLSLKESETRFGCPDCADQCLFYVEIGNGTKVSQVFIDTDRSQLPGYLKKFTDEIEKTIELIK